MRETEYVMIVQSKVAWSNIKNIQCLHFSRFKSTSEAFLVTCTCYLFSLIHRHIIWHGYKLTISPIMIHRHSSTIGAILIHRHIIWHGHKSAIMIHCHIWNRHLSTISAIMIHRHIWNRHKSTISAIVIHRHIWNRHSSTISAIMIHSHIEHRHKSTISAVMIHRRI